MTFFGQGERPEARECSSDLLSLADSMAEAARKLKSEVMGIVGIAGPEIRQIVGNTNVNCLMQRVEQVHTQLLAWDAARKGK